MRFGIGQAVNVLGVHPPKDFNLIIFGPLLWAVIQVSRISRFCALLVTFAVELFRLGQRQCEDNRMQLGSFYFSFKMAAWANAIHDYLETEIDIAAYLERRAESEISIDEIMKKLKK